MIYGYARVSSNGQKLYGQSLDVQKEALLSAGCEKIYSDAYTGMTMERPEFGKLMQELKSGDTLIVTKLDRFARKASEGVDTIMELLDRGVTVNILNMGVADNTPMGKLMVNILLAFAEFEHDNIVSRLNDGKAMARKKNPDGYKEGRRATPEDKIRVAQEAVASGASVSAACRMAGISRAVYYRNMA